MSNFFWVAKYNDGTELIQHEPSGKTNKYPDIDRKKLSCFELHNKTNCQPIVTINFKPGQRLIYRERVQGHNDETGIIIVDRRYYLVGWQQTINNKNTQLIHIVHPDGNVELIDRWDNTKILYNEPNLMDEEK